jgi:mono/diheme cytochrome c family protein
MKGFQYIAIAAAGFALATSCVKDKSSPGYEFMPDMYYSPAYKPGEENPNFADGKTYREPVSGTIAYSENEADRLSFMPYPYTDSPEDRERAFTDLRNPLTADAMHLRNGERLYGIYCAPCHGLQGKGDGSVVKVLEKKDNYGLKPPAYDSDELRDISEGRIFHAMQYGKGNMGSYASQLTAHERWQVTLFVQTLQKTVAPAEAVADASDAPSENQVVMN